MFVGGEADCDNHDPDCDDHDDDCDDHDDDCDDHNLPTEFGLIPVPALDAGSFSPQKTQRPEIVMSTLLLIYDGHIFLII